MSLKLQKPQGMIRHTIVTLLSLFSLSGQCNAQYDQNIMRADTTLHYIIKESKTSYKEPAVLFLLHGHGSNENDLFSFHTAIPDNWIVVSVRAPYRINDRSFRWYDVNMLNGKITINSEEEEKSRKKLLQLISEITGKYKVNTNKVIVAGFSQGANMASTIGLTQPDKISGIAIFSGRFIHEIQPYISKSDKIKNLKCFLAHGNKDDLLPVAYAYENLKELDKLGISITFSEDAVSHTISTKQFSDFILWLNQL